MKINIKWYYTLILDFFLFLIMTMLKQKKINITLIWVIILLLQQWCFASFLLHRLLLFFALNQTRLLGCSSIFPLINNSQKKGTLAALLPDSPLIPTSFLVLAFDRLIFLLILWYSVEILIFDVCLFDTQWYMIIHKVCNVSSGSGYAATRCDLHIWSGEIWYFSYLSFPMLVSLQPFPELILFQLLLVGLRI